jgi:poly-gamma-glutamate system protein
MAQAIAAIRESRERSGARFDLELDPNRTGLIGPQVSPLMTTAGDLQAKRTTTNPNFAGFLVHLLCRTGARPGDSVAIGSSGSFPALLVAALSAARALDLRPVTILSLGASSYGATDPDFDLLEIYDVLVRQGICSSPPAAVSLGGERDVGSDMEDAVRSRMIRGIEGRARFLRESNLERNVAERTRIYEEAARGRIAAFINAGGGYANLGTSRLVLNVRPGLNLDLVLPRPEERGMLFAMAARGVPVIHLLFIKGLVLQAGLPWDPIPLPGPEALRLPDGAHGAGFWLVTAVYFLALIPLVPRRNKF